MNKLKIKNSFYWILTLVLLAGPAHEVFAQKTRVHSDRRSSEKKVTRKTDEKKKNVRRDLKKNLEKNKQRKDTRKNPSYRIKENRTYKKGYGRSKLKSRFHNKKSFGSKHFRKPSWVDYHTRRHYYPKIGTRFSFLPHGYISFRIGSYRFFVYKGTYYRYDPVYRTYVVIEKPVIKSNYTSTKWDRITLTDGSTIEGAYISGDNEKVFFEVGNDILEIPKSEIQVLSFSQE